MSMIWFAMFNMLVVNVVHRATDGDLAVGTGGFSAVI